MKALVCGFVMGSRAGVQVVWVLQRTDGWQVVFESGEVVVRRKMIMTWKRVSIWELTTWKSQAAGKPA